MSYNYPLLLYRKPSVFSKPWSQKNLKKVQGSFSFFLWWLLLLLMGATERNSKQSSYLQKEKKMKRKEGRTGVGMNLVKVVVVRASGRLSFNSPAITTT